MSIKKEYIMFFGIMALFLLLRLPAIHAPYHQDEYKWPIIVNPALTAPGGIPHPPLSEAIYRATFNIFGSDNFRVTPLIFSIFNLGLLYMVVRRRYGVKTALWSSLFFALSFYGILASLMVDTDGAVLPFFFLISLWFYDSFRLSPVLKEGNKKWLWLGLCILSMVLGMLVKVSFAIGIGAIFLDFVLKNFKNLSKKTLGLYALGLIGFAVLIGLLLYFARDLFPGFDLSKALVYWEGFMKGFGSRNFFQSGIQFVKALLYLSPFLVLSGVASLFLYRKELKLFHIFIALGLIFYLVLFDFSAGALDRYFQFMVLPLSIIAGFMTERVFFTAIYGKTRKSIIYIGSILTGLIFLSQFINQFVPPLYPKSEWVSRILAMKWNFLYPFSGGSGPLTFYVSWSLLALSWILGVLLIALFLWKKDIKREVWIAFLVLGLVYNGVFSEEYLFGRINGFAPTLVAHAAEFIKNDADIKKVVVYNDNGGYEIRNTGKYEKRLYTADYFDPKEKAQTINNFSGHYLVIDAPRIDPNSIYAKYLATCKKVYEEKDHYMSATVYDCRQAPDIKI